MSSLVLIVQTNAIHVPIFSVKTANMDTETTQTMVEEEEPLLSNLDIFLFSLIIGLIIYWFMSRKKSEPIPEFKKLETVAWVSYMAPLFSQYWFKKKKKLYNTTHMWWYCLSSCLLHIITLFALKQVCERTWITALVNVPLVLTFAWFSYSRRCWLLWALPSRPQPPPRSFTQEEWTLVNSRVACPRISPLLYHNCTLFFDGNQKFSRGQTCSCSKTVRRQTVLGGGVWWRGRGVL